MIDPTSGELIDASTDVSFVNNIGHSWISSIELFFNDKNVIDQSTQSYAYKSFIENCLSYSNHKKNLIFREVIGSMTMKIMTNSKELNLLHWTPEESF